MPVALVIGASRGIGREFVRQLLAQGWQVFATGRDDRAVTELTSAGAHGIRLHVDNPESLAALGWKLDGVELDLALYVAGVYGPAQGADTPPIAADFDHVMHTNVLGAMQAIPLLAPMVEAADGCFAFVTSGMGSIAGAESSNAWIYRASKAALNMAVRSASMDYPKARMIALSPGWVQTDMGGASALLKVEHSVAGMLDAIGRVTAGDTGSFINYEGKSLPW